jgi:hypothetical protein
MVPFKLSAKLSERGKELPGGPVTSDTVGRDGSPLTQPQHLRQLALLARLR